METSIKNHQKGQGSNKPHMLIPKNRPIRISQPGNRCQGSGGMVPGGCWLWRFSQGHRQPCGWLSALEG